MKKKDYFYTCNAVPYKIYVFWNGGWLNQLMKVSKKYYWVSLNQCGINWNTGESFSTAQKAIERAMSSQSVYQLDALKELAEFIKTRCGD